MTARSVRADIDQTSLNQWFAVAAVSDIVPNTVASTMLMETPVSYAVDRTGRVAAAWRSRSELRNGSSVAPASMTAELGVRVAYGYLWTSLGEPEAEIFPLPEYDEADRRNVHAGTFGVRTSAPRVIENFLDMGHFPYIHAGILGAEPHTEVKDYSVEVSVVRDEILATGCTFYQPKGSSVARTGANVDYVYRVPHPFCAVLYKKGAVSNPRANVIALFLQPVSQDYVRAHMLMCILDSENKDAIIKLHQQRIFGQDKPILENQLPKRLPLDPSAETSIRSDKTSVAYRRWLAQKNVRYGVIAGPS